MAAQSPLADPDFAARIEITAIVFDRRRNQIRQVTTGTKIHSTFAYPSKRFRRAGRGDGETELMVHKIHECEVVKLDFLPQPCRIEGVINGRPAKAVPDYAAVAIGDQPVLGEVKASWEEFDRPRARIQRALTEQAALLLGWDYEQKVPENLGSKDYLANIEEVQAHRFAHVSLRQEAAVVAAVASGCPITMDDVAGALDESSGRGRSLACALMVRRIIDIDLSKPLGGRSVVRRAPSRPFAWPSIRL